MFSTSFSDEFRLELIFNFMQKKQRLIFLVYSCLSAFKARILSGAYLVRIMRNMNEMFESIFSLLLKVAKKCQFFYILRNRRIFLKIDNS